MISTFAMVGMGVIFLVCLLLPVGGLLYCIRKTGRANILFIAIVGLAAVSVANSMSGIVSGLGPVYSLTQSGSVGEFLLYLLIAAIVLGAMETLVRYLIVNYVSKTEIGVYKVLSAGIGMGSIGLMYATQYLQMIMQAQMINNGTFIEAVTTAEGSTVTVEQAQTYIDSVSAMSPFYYYVQALDYLTALLLQVALILVFTKLFMEGRKAAALLITTAVKIVFEFLRMLTYYSSSEYLGYAVSEEAGLALNAAVLLVAAVGSVIVYKVIKPQIPAEYPAAPKKKVQEKQFQEKKAWNEMQNLGQKNLSSIEFEDPYEEGSSPDGEAVQESAAAPAQEENSLPADREDEEKTTENGQEE